MRAALRVTTADATVAAALRCGRASHSRWSSPPRAGTRHSRASRLSVH
ncbi:hypothetical protein NKG05_23185 [Oerskovia sp. M15]